MADLGAIGVFNTPIFSVRGDVLTGTVLDSNGDPAGDRIVHILNRAKYPNSADTAPVWDVTATKADGTYSYPIPDDNLPGNPPRDFAVVVFDDVAPHALVHDKVTP